MSVLDSLRRHYRQEHAPSGISFPKFLQTLQGLIDKKYGRDKNNPTATYRTLLVAGMHFMDSYNYDVERVKRCVIHYAAPDGQLYPFCAYNAGPTFREKVEKKYSVALDRQPELLDRFQRLYRSIKCVQQKNNGKGKTQASCKADEHYLHPVRTRWLYRQ